MNQDDGFDEDEEDVEYYAVRPNKTRIKQEIAELFALGETLSTLSADSLDSLELPDNIKHAVLEAARLPHNSARKRTLKYIAGHLHKMDVTPIQAQLARLQNTSAHAVREHHTIERWRDRLIDEGNNALTELFDEQPHIDLQHVRHLLRNIKKESECGQPPKSARLLYRYLKDAFLFEVETDFRNNS